MSRCDKIINEATDKEKLQDKLTSKLADMREKMQAHIEKMTKAGMKKSNIGSGKYIDLKSLNKALDNIK